MNVPFRRQEPALLTAVRLETTVAKIGRQGLTNAEAHLRPITALQKLYPPELFARTIEIAERCRFSLTEFRYPCQCSRAALIGLGVA